MDSNTVTESDMSSKIQIILAQGEWSSAKDAGPILKRCNTRQRQTFCHVVSVYVFNISSICIHGTELLGQFDSHQKSRKGSHNETDVWHMSECNQLGRFFMETFIFDWRWRSHQSLAREGLRIFRFCVILWKDEREPNIKYCLGRKVELVQRFITIQSFGQNWWWANGVRVEYFPRIHHTVALQQSPRVPVKNERRASRIYRTDHLPLNSFLFKREDFQ